MDSQVMKTAAVLLKLTREDYDTEHLSYVAHTRMHTHPIHGSLDLQVRTNMDFTKAGDSEWQWHQLGHMQICTSPQTDNDASTPPLSFLQAGCPSSHPTNSVKSLKANPSYTVIPVLPTVQQIKFTHATYLTMLYNTAFDTVFGALHSLYQVLICFKMLITLAPNLTCVNSTPYDIYFLYT